jgi:hypothetical protein
LGLGIGRTTVVSPLPRRGLRASENFLDWQTVLCILGAPRPFTVPAVLVLGNHYPLDATSIFRSRTFVADCPGNVHVADGSSPVHFSDVDVAIYSRRRR